MWPLQLQKNTNDMSESYRSLLKDNKTDYCTRFTHDPWHTIFLFLSEHLKKVNIKSQYNRCKNWNFVKTSEVSALLITTANWMSNEHTYTLCDDGGFKIKVKSSLITSD